MFFFQVPLILLVKNPSRILSLLGGLFLIAVGLLILTPLGFPYSGDPAGPAAQRFMIAVSVISLTQTEKWRWIRSRIVKYVPEWVHVLKWVEKCKVNLYRTTIFKGNIVALTVMRNKEGNFLFKWWTATVGTTVETFWPLGLFVQCIRTFKEKCRLTITGVTAGGFLTSQSAPKVQCRFSSVECIELWWQKETNGPDCVVVGFRSGKINSGRWFQPRTSYNIRRWIITTNHNSFLSV